MSRFSEEPDDRAQCSVADLLARYGEAAPSTGRRRRRASEESTYAAPESVLDRVRTDSGPTPTDSLASDPLLPVSRPGGRRRAPEPDLENPNPVRTDADRGLGPAAFGDRSWPELGSRGWGDLNPQGTNGHSSSNGHTSSSGGNGYSSTGNGHTLNGDGSTVNRYGSALDGHGSAVDGYGSTVDGYGSAVNGHGSAVNGRGRRRRDRHTVADLDSYGLDSYGLGSSGLTQRSRHSREPDSSLGEEGSTWSASTHADWSASTHANVPPVTSKPTVPSALSDGPPTDQLPRVQPAPPDPMSSPNPVPPNPVPPHTVSAGPKPVPAAPGPSSRVGFLDEEPLAGYQTVAAPAPSRTGRGDERRGFDERYYEDLGDEVPYFEDDADVDEDVSPAREWLVMATQIGVGVVGGAGLWLISEWFWQRIPVVALVMALAVITGLVWVVRRVRRAEDLQTTVIAVLVGLFVTVSPAALLLVGS